MQILIVDNNGLSAQRAAEILGREGLETKVAGLREARAAMGTQPFGGMVICVQDCPEEALALIHEASRSMPVIGCAATLVPYEEAALRAGCTAFVEKPFAPAEMAMLAERCLS